MRTELALIALTMFSCSAFAEDGINLPGDDYANFSAPTPNSCRNNCAGEPSAGLRLLLGIMKPDDSEVPLTIQQTDITTIQI